MRRIQVQEQLSLVLACSLAGGDPPKMDRRQKASGETSQPRMTQNASCMNENFTADGARYAVQTVEQCNADAKRQAEL